MPKSKVAPDVMFFAKVSTDFKTGGWGRRSSPRSLPRGSSEARCDFTARADLADYSAGSWAIPRQIGIRLSRSF